MMTHTGEKPAIMLFFCQSHPYHQVGVVVRAARAAPRKGDDVWDMPRKARKQMDVWRRGGGVVRAARAPRIMRLCATAWRGAERRRNVRARGVVRVAVNAAGGAKGAAAYKRARIKQRGSNIAGAAAAARRRL